MARLTYTVLLEPDPDEGGFTVTVAELPGCITQGETVDEALAMAQEVIAPHLEGLAEDGLPVPVEQYLSNSPRLRWTWVRWLAFRRPARPFLLPA